MQLPSFDEFLSTLSEDDYKKFSSINTYHIIQLKDPPNCEDLSAALNQMTGYILKGSTKFSVEMLRTYHNWLSEKLEEK